MTRLFAATALAALSALAGCAASEKSATEPEVHYHFGPDAGENSTTPVKKPKGTPCMPGQVCQPVTPYTEPSRF